MNILACGSRFNVLARALEASLSAVLDGPWKLGKSDDIHCQRWKGQNYLGVVSNKGSKSQSSGHVLVISLLSLSSKSTFLLAL